MDIIEQGSMRQVFIEVYKILAHDEELMRLLYYPAEDAHNPQPLSKDLPNLMDRADIWDIRRDRIIRSDKSSDIEGEPKCRIYIYPEKRRSRWGNYLIADQGISFSIFVHESFDSDGRMQWISDRLYKLLSLERVPGSIGMLEYVKGDPWTAPRQYSQYRHVFQFTTSKK